MKTAQKSCPQRHDCEAWFNVSNVTYKTQAIFIQPQNLWAQFFREKKTIVGLHMYLKIKFQWKSFWSKKQNFEKFNLYKSMLFLEQQNKTRTNSIDEHSKLNELDRIICGKTELYIIKETI